MHAGYGNVKSFVERVGNVQHMTGTYTRRIMKIIRVDQVPYTGTIENPHIKLTKRQANACQRHFAKVTVTNSLFYNRGFF